MESGSCTLHVVDYYYCYISLLGVLCRESVTMQPLTEASNDITENIDVATPLGTFEVQ